MRYIIWKIFWEYNISFFFSLHICKCNWYIPVKRFQFITKCKDLLGHPRFSTQNSGIIPKKIPKIWDFRGCFWDDPRNLGFFGTFPNHPRYLKNIPKDWNFLGYLTWHPKRIPENWNWPQNLGIKLGRSQKDPKILGWIPKFWDVKKYCYPWISMDIHGYFCISIMNINDIHGYPWYLKVSDTQMLRGKEVDTGVHSLILNESSILLIYPAWCYVKVFASGSVTSTPR